MEHVMLLMFQRMAHLCHWSPVHHLSIQRSLFISSPSVCLSVCMSLCASTLTFYHFHRYSVSVILKIVLIKYYCIYLYVNSDQFNTTD